jgi:hypothetical protein
VRASWARKALHTREQKLAQKSGTRFVFCTPLWSSYILREKWNPLYLFKTVGNPIRWSTCITTRHVALYRVHPCLASRDIMTCQKTNMLYHHHHHHGACPSKLTAAVVFPFLSLSSSLIHVHFFPHPVAHISPSFLSLLFKTFLLPQCSFGLYPLLTFTSFSLSLLSHSFRYPFICLSYRYSYTLIFETGKRYLQFGFCWCPSNGATIQPPFFPEGDRNCQLLMCSFSILFTVLLQLVSVLLLKQHLTLSSTWIKYGLYWTSSQWRKKKKKTSKS